MNRLTKHRAAAGALALCACACATAAFAHGTTESCSAATLQGTYVFAASGYSLIGGVWSPKAIVESMRFNGDGTLSVLSSTLANLTGNGAVIQVPPGGAGTYALNPDCTGTLSFVPGPTFAVVATPKGDDAWMIQANPNNVFQGSVRRLAK